jgi:ketosteroid isomerase-like protein
MSDFQAHADRVEIESLRGEFADAAMMRDYDRLVSLFTADGTLRIPDIPLDLAGREEIRAWTQHVPTVVDYLVQHTHQGPVRFNGDTARGRTHVHEVGRRLDGRSWAHHAIYHDRYRRTGDGWKFAERVYEIRHQDAAPPDPAPGAEGPQ